MTDGWIKLHRKSLDSVVFQDCHIWQLWCYCLLKANHKPNKFLWNGKVITIERGQFITGRKELSEALHQNSSSVYRRLQILKKLEKVNIKSNNKFSIVTVIKYSSYQDDKKQDEQQSEQQMNNKRTTNEQQMNTNKNVKNDKNEKKKIKNTVAENRCNGIEIPSILDFPDFQSAWQEWIQYRQQIRKSLTPISAKKQLDKLSQNPADAVAIINQSIQNQWQGLFELKNQTNGHGKHNQSSNSRQWVDDNIKATEQLIRNITAN